MNCHNAILISSENSESLKKFMDQYKGDFKSDWTKNDDFSFSNYKKTANIPLDKFLEMSKIFSEIEFKLSFFYESLKHPCAGQYKIKNGKEEIIKYWSNEWHNERGKKFFDAMTKLYFPQFREIIGN